MHFLWRVGGCPHPLGGNRIILQTGEGKAFPSVAKAYRRKYVGYDPHVKSPDGSYGAHVFDFGSSP